MSSYLDEITLGLSPHDPFSEEMEVGSPSPTQEEVAPGSPGDQALRDFDTDQWPSQVPEDQLLGASQLVQELSDGSSSGDENDNGLGEELLVDLSETEEEEEVQEIRSPPPEEDVPMAPAPAPTDGSRPSPPSTPAPSWVDIMDQQEVEEGPESAETAGALLEEQRTLRRQHSLESLAAFGDLEVEVVGRVTSHLRLKGDLQDALTATCR